MDPERVSFELGEEEEEKDYVEEFRGLGFEPPRLEEGEEERGERVGWRRVFGVGECASFLRVWRLGS